jgi:hypothetical protein
MLTQIDGLSDAQDFLFDLPVDGGAPVEIQFGKDDQISQIRTRMAEHGWYAFMATRTFTVVPIYIHGTGYQVVFDQGGRPHHKKLILLKGGYVGERSKAGPFTQYRVADCRSTKIGTFPTIGGDMKAKVEQMIAWIADTGLGEELAWQVFAEVGLNAKALVRRVHDLTARYCHNSREELVETMTGVWEAGDPMTEEGLEPACKYLVMQAGWNVHFDHTVRLYFRLFKHLTQPEVEWRWLQPAPDSAQERIAA